MFVFDSVMIDYSKEPGREGERTTSAKAITTVSRRLMIRGSP